MEKISGASSNNKNSKISEKIEKSLQDWKLPPFSASNVYKGSGIFNIFSGCKVKTVEEEISFSEKFATFNLLSKNLINGYPEDFKYFHIGMVQVALKPTKVGSNISAIICLRNKDCNNFHESVWGMVESSLCNGPIYFTYFPPPQRSSSASDLSSGICIDVNIEGSSMMGGDESMILMYRFHYKLMNKRYRPRTRTLCRRGADEEGKTTLFLTDIAKSNRVVSKIISWDQVVVPARWMVECSDSSSSSIFDTRVMWEETAETLVLKVWNFEFKKEDVRVEVEDGNILQIREERKRSFETSKYETFCRRFRLPENARLDQLTAAMDNKMLTVTVPKARDEKKGGVKVMA